MVQLTTVLAGAILLVTVSCTVYRQHNHHSVHEEEHVHEFEEAKPKKWNWWSSWRTPEKHIEHEEIHSPVWKIHKYQGVEIKPMKEIDTPLSINHHPLTFHPPTSVSHNVHHTSPHIHHEVPSPVYVPELHSSPWKPSSTGWKWTRPFTHDHHTIHIQEPDTHEHKTVVSKLRAPFKTGWFGGSADEHKIPTVEASIPVHAIPESPEIHFPGIQEIHIPKISHIPMAIPIHQTTTTVIEHHAPKKEHIEVHEHVPKKHYGSYEKGHAHAHEYAKEVYEEEYVPKKNYEPEYSYEESYPPFPEKKEKIQLYNSYGEALPPNAYGSEPYQSFSEKEGNSQLYNSYGEALPSNAYGSESKKVEIFVPPPHNPLNGTVRGDIGNYLTTNQAKMDPRSDVEPMSSEEASILNHLAPAT